MRPAFVCLSLLCVLALAGVAAPSHSQTADRLQLFPLEKEATGTSPAPIYTSALQEMLRSSNGQSEHWDRAPELTVLVSVMEYHGGEPVTPATYIATAEQLTDTDADELTKDLTAALGLLTGNTYDQFATIHRESVAPGTRIGVLRPGQILAGRYRNVQTLAHTLGFGGRASRGDGTITGAAIILDNDYDRTSAKRRLLRTHELGHALGYNHVQSQLSIMNPHIGSEPTDFDRAAARVAFHAPLAMTAN